ncbi:hypothetical protein N658DRAFT_158785 [Parathielavia hyrcaniae]|uniref:Uncharacterized protein n=1 Tax=Parathielavia hyrcaniae TaxID=113614 RepID=A0AAN6PZ09_9PEZI|nr:hypothetical protein N658DRAFT_158785 [Parathielavia hyrcaniae]
MHKLTRAVCCCALPIWPTPTPTLILGILLKSKQSSSYPPLDQEADRYCVDSNKEVTFCVVPLANRAGHAGQMFTESVVPKVLQGRKSLPCNDFTSQRPRPTGSRRNG